MTPTTVSDFLKFISIFGGTVILLLLFEDEPPPPLPQPLSRVDKIINIYKYLNSILIFIFYLLLFYRYFVYSK